MFYNIPYSGRNKIGNLVNAFVLASRIFFFAWLCIAGGCGTGTGVPERTVKGDNCAGQLSAYIPYTAAKLDIMPLTEFVPAADSEEGLKIKVYVGISDSFESQIKTPGVFRFELYEYAHLSATPKGKRVVIWPDIELTDTTENNSHWRDFLRAYEFNLDFTQETRAIYILQVTCICPNGRRLSGEFNLK